LARVRNVRGGPRLVPLSTILVHESVDHLIRPALVGLAVALVLTLLVCCFNVAALTFARNAFDVRLTAVRVALGCGPRAILLKAFVEASVVSLGVTAAAVLLTTLLASAAMHASFVVSTLRIAPNFMIDWRLLLFAYALAFVCMCGAGMLPSSAQVRLYPASILCFGGASLTPSVSTTRLRLVGLQIFVSVALIVAGASLTRGFQTRLSLDKDNQKLQDLRMLETNLDYRRRSAAATEAVEELERIIRAVPSGVSGAFATHIPFDGYQRSVEVSTDAGRVNKLYLQVNHVSSNYFALVGMRIQEGRAFSLFDSRHSEPVAIVTKRQIDSPGLDLAVGQEIYLWEGDSYTVVRIVGIAEGISESTPGQRNSQTIFRPILQVNEVGRLTWVYRQQSDGEAVRRIFEIQESGGSLPILRSGTVKSLLDDYMQPIRAASTVLKVLGSAAALVSAFGLIGMVFQHVIERSRETAVRLALGATPGVVTLNDVWKLAPTVVLASGLGAVTGNAPELLLGSQPQASITTLAVAVSFVVVTFLITLAVTTSATLLVCRRATVALLRVD